MRNELNDVVLRANHRILLVQATPLLLAARDRHYLKIMTVPQMVEAERKYGELKAKMNKLHLKNKAGEWERTLWGHHCLRNGVGYDHTLFSVVTETLTSKPKRIPHNLMLDDLQAFLQRCRENPDQAYDLFENHCTERLRSEVYSHSDPSGNEPFRAAMDKLGVQV